MQWVYSSSNAGIIIVLLMLLNEKRFYTRSPFKPNTIFLFIFLLLLYFFIFMYTPVVSFQCNLSAHTVSPLCNSHRSLYQLPLQLPFPPGVQDAASDSQSGAGLRRVELNDGQRQGGQGRRAVKDGHTSIMRVRLSVYSFGLAIVSRCKHTHTALWLLGRGYAWV